MAEPEKIHVETPQNKSLVILNYHHVGVAPKNARYKRLFVRPSHLETHVLFLQRRGFEFSTLKDAMTKNSARMAVVTFDDGYADNLTNGLSVLSKLNVPATLFVPTCAVGKQRFFFQEAGDKTPSDFLNSQQLLTLRDAGWEIASHGHEHIHLGRHSVQKQKEDLQTSKKILEDLLAQEIVSLAYPYGNFGSETKTVTAEVGFKYAVTTEQGLASGADFFELKRIPLFGQNLLHLPINILSLMRHLKL